MAGIGITSASAGSDVVSLSKSSSRSKGSGSDSQRFQDALSSSGNSTDANAASKRSTADTNSVDTTASEPDTGKATGETLLQASNSATGSATPAPVGDGTLLPVPPVAPPVPGAPLVSLPAAPVAVPAALALVVPADDGAAVKLPAADIAQQLADVVAGAATGEPATPVKGDLPGVKGSKSGADSDDSKDADANASDASVANGAVADVLSLLGAGLSAAVIPAQTSASVLAAAGQLHTGNGKIDPGAASVANALPADAADDSGDAVAVGMAMLAPSMGSAGQGNAVAGTSTDGDAPVTFNVDRASGKVQSLDLSASRNADDTPQLDIKSASGDTGATVTVLDSRRFVGLADGSNSALVANSLTGNKDWAAAMQPNAALTGASATTSASKVMNTLKIQMNPDNLGIVTATMRLSGEQLSVDLKVHSAEAYRQLSNDQSAMIDSLRQQGYSVDRMTVTYTAPDTSSNNQQSPQGQQQQQPGTSQGQGSDGQARRQNSGRQAGDQDGISRAGNVGTDDSVAGSAQRARAGGVYL
ncbi:MULTISPECIES: flagellar hook-length control protein FliK [unclassified Rhizobium]|uniref:flagellar hook-length control protein FliK n=1 Tax=unclassified Rhizobium TaxID=2613769 RepID=UPI00115E83BD|nr:MULTISPECIES: flagellar hook-length control protein FliK [unclassified Rhizobium]MBZ5760396.1 flagellar hook-length control protein FliK [Rhizobium sp. VS19-DR96]MBZ5766760.1 flagellar hook-length control protein FliK [Rhizobium sp. VS19-DR129.2]MBZ5773247.1 flagellar hook-length control protein FliK [Rhizobium sp. VS19-DRK62.2]MBZ5784231.1 flagellar hook-length control protein FliK [Rhizobium sp. VS19-DR121]MBZ5802591.1 flagellar hook-length control protein FliK [Rhizobium sp. VS19-DR181]